MNLIRLYEILNDCTVPKLRNEETVSNEFEKIDLEFFVLYVNKSKVVKHKTEFIALLNAYPEPLRLAGGPSYIEVGAVLGGQGAALQVFGIGKVLGLWNVITPSSLGLIGKVAEDAAGHGFIMITGYKPEVREN